MAITNQNLIPEKRESEHRPAPTWGEGYDLGEYYGSYRGHQGEDFYGGGSALTPFQYQSPFLYRGNTYDYPYPYQYYQYPNLYPYQSPYSAFYPGY